MPDRPVNALIVGGNGGIGSALTQALASAPRDVNVTATWHRTPPEWSHPRVQWVQVDPTCAADLAELSARLDRLDWLINAVGILHDDQGGPERTIKRFDPDFLLHSITVNTLPTLLLAKHFHTQLQHEEPSMFATISARVGSIEENQLGGWYSYRASKAALNMALKTLAIEWRRLVPKACVAALHPGTVDTRLSEPFQRGVKPAKLFTASHSAACLLQILDRLEPEDTGRFWSWDGTELPW
jgi:NAD(P)-dependent dehydrogenase (short-subunit alcohol dehydrogenase family)